MFTIRHKYILLICLLILIITISGCFLPFFNNKQGQKWEQVTANAEWIGRFDHASVVYDGKMWVMGGNSNYDSYTYHNDVWSSTDGITWTEVRADDTNESNWGVTIWSPRGGHTVHVFNNKMWLIGISGEIWSTSDGVDWTPETLNAGWSTRDHHASVVYDNKLWVIGGNSNVYWSVNGIDWTLIELDHDNYDNCWSERRYLSAVVYQDKIWVMGGDEPGVFGLYMDDVWNTTDGENWTRTTVDAGWKARWGHESIVYDNKIWVLGGYAVVKWQTDEDMNDVWNTEDGNDWEEIVGNADWLERRLHTAVVYDGLIWILGGYSMFTEPDGELNDVWKVILPEE